MESEEKHPTLCGRTNVAVISDEAHRSQYGLTARLKTIKDKATGEVTGSRYVFGYAKHMRDALPFASFIGFTGTPIDKEDKYPPDGANEAIRLVMAQAEALAEEWSDLSDLSSSSDCGLLGSTHYYARRAEDSSDKHGAMLMMLTSDH